MRKYRVKQVGNRFYIQYRCFFIWFKVTNYYDVCIEYGSLEAAKKRIGQFIKEDEIKYHPYP